MRIEDMSDEEVIAIISDVHDLLQNGLWPTNYVKEIIAETTGEPIENINANNIRMFGWIVAGTLADRLIAYKNNQNLLS